MWGTPILDPLAVWIAAAWLSVLMLHAGLTKAFDRLQFVQHLGAYRVPDGWIWPMSLLLPVAELLCGALLLTPWRAAAAAVELTAAAPMAERELRWADQAVVLGAVLLGALLWAAFHQVLRQVRRTSTV